MIKKIKGIVGHGKQLGRTVGMPTVNLVTLEDVSGVKDGVYASITTVRGKRYLGVTNVGLRPTVDDEKHRTIETYLLDFSEDIYGEEIELELHQYLRAIKKFADIEAVKAQVEEDIKQINISL